MARLAGWNAAGTATTSSTTTIKPLPDDCVLLKIYDESSEEIELLRHVRDNVLNQTHTGKELIRLYYEWSPVVVKVMEADEDFKQEVYFDYLLKFDWIDANRQRIYARTNPIKLIKLNGSLDWGICPSCNRLYLYFQHMFRHSYDGKRCSLKCGEPVQPFIVIPHEKYESIIEPLWTLAERELKRANIVTIIGYSFPEYDKKVIDLFSSSLAPHTKLQVVNHCERKENEDGKRNAILLKYRQLFPILKTEIGIYLNGFEGYIDSHTN